MFEPVSRVTLSQTIIEEIIKAIKQGVWLPDSRIPTEKELAETFSVSRNSIREAIKTLNAMKVIESRPGRGTFLAHDAMRQILSSELIDSRYKDVSLTEIIEIRMLLEAQSAYWAAVRANDDELNELRAVLDLAENSMSMDIAEQDRVHALFHETVIRISGNTFVRRLLSSIRAEIETQRSGFDKMPAAELSDVIKDQEVIIRHILNKDAENARASMEKHLEKGFKLFKKWLPDSQQHDLF